jgi:hypothetical protein
MKFSQKKPAPGQMPGAGIVAFTPVVDHSTTNLFVNLCPSVTALTM